MKKWTAMVLAAVLVFSLTGCKSSDYKKAVSDLNAGNHAAALSAFQALGDYKDSQELAKKCEYALAVADFDKGSFESAKAAFQALGDYEASADYIVKCDYNLALAKFDAGDYEAAAEGFRALADYEDSADYLAKAEKAIFTAKVTGTWVSDGVNLTTFMVSILSGQDPILDEVIGEYALPDVIMNVRLELKGDGSFSVSAEATGVEEFEAKLTDVMYRYLVVVIENALAEQGYTMEDLYAEAGTDDMDEIFTMMLGVSLDEYMQIVDIRGQFEEALESNTESGTFTAENGKVILDDGELTYDEEADQLVMQDRELIPIIGGSTLTYHRQ